MVVDDYFGALARRDVEGMAALWAEDGEEHLWGVAPTGARVTVEIARQLGLVPAAGSTAEQRLFSAFNTKTRVERRAVAKGQLERAGA
jgi:ketosteroid isomerase-like protein